MPIRRLFEIKLRFRFLIILVFFNGLREEHEATFFCFFLFCQTRYQAQNALSIFVHRDDFSAADDCAKKATMQNTRFHRLQLY